MLDACTRGLGHILPLARPWRFALVMLVFGSIAVLAIGWGIVRSPAQVQMLMQVMDTQLGILEAHLETFDIDLFGPGGRQDLSHLIADPGRLFGHVHYAVSGAYAVAINTIVIVCLGVFFAGHPAGYREGRLILLPVAARARVREVMNEMGQMLRSWLLGSSCAARSWPCSWRSRFISLACRARACSACRPAWQTSSPILAR